MLLLMSGVLLLALGLFSGLALVLAAFDAMPGAAGLTLWVTFPLLTLLGFVLAGMNGSIGQMRTLGLVASAVLLLLALGSVAAVVLSSAGVVSPPSARAPLWFVVGVGAVLGAAGAAGFGRRRIQA